MERYHIAENTVQETLIIPLYGRKLGSELYPGILDDPYSAAAAGRLDYDFAELDKKKRTAAWRFGALEGILRPRDILEEMKEHSRRGGGSGQQPSGTAGIPVLAAGRGLSAGNRGDRGGSRAA